MNLAMIFGRDKLVSATSNLGAECRHRHTKLSIFVRYVCVTASRGGSNTCQPQLMPIIVEMQKNYRPRECNDPFFTPNSPCVDTPDPGTGSQQLIGLSVRGYPYHSVAWVPGPSLNVPATVLPRDDSSVTSEIGMSCGRR